MSSPEIFDPYGSSALPYQAYREREEASPQQKQSASSASSVPRLSKAQALARADTYKKMLAVGSLVSFGVLSTLVGGSIVQANSQQTKPVLSTPTPTSPSDPSTNAPSGQGGFFQQPQGGGYSVGNDPSWQPPVSGSHVS